MIVDVGGCIHEQGSLCQFGASLVFVVFTIGEDEFRIVWPVLHPSDVTDESNRAAKQQAATFLYHEVKSICVKAKVFGARLAFLPYLVVGGKALIEHAGSDLSDEIAAQLTSNHDDCKVIRQDRPI